MTSGPKGDQSVQQDMPSVETPREPDQLGTQFGTMIGKALKAQYDEIIQAPVPDKFLDLLAKLEASEGSQ